MNTHRETIFRRWTNAEARVADVEFYIEKHTARVVELKRSGDDDAAEKAALVHYDTIRTILINDRDRLLHACRCRWLREARPPIQ